jgi:hypothetical protein
MSDEPVVYGYPATVQLFNGFDARARLSLDLAHNGPVLFWLFLMQADWLIDLIGPHLTHSHCQVLADHRQRSALKQFVKGYKMFHAATWATNRTQHDKTVLFPALNIAYLTTANITRGSWYLSHNSFLRVHSPSLVKRLEDEFHLQWRAARPLLPSER